MQKKFALNYIFPLYKRLKMKKKKDMNEYKRDLFLQGKNPCITWHLIYSREYSKWTEWA